MFFDDKTRPTCRRAAAAVLLATSGGGGERLRSARVRAARATAMTIAEWTPAAAAAMLVCRLSLRGPSYVASNPWD